MSDQIGTLLAQAIAGDEVALQELMLAHHDRLLAFIERRLPLANRGTLTAEDIAQETYMVVFRQIRQFEPKTDASFMHWISKIAEHRLLDALKAMRAAKRGGGRAGLQQPLDSSQTVALLELLAVNDRTPSMSVAGVEAVGALREALAQVKPDYQEALRLRYIEGLPIADVAARLGRTEGAVNMLLSRALKAVEELMTDGGAAPG